MTAHAYAPIRADSGERIASALADVRAYVSSALADPRVSKADALHRVDGALTHVETMLDVLPCPRVEVVELPAGPVAGG